MEGKKKKNKPLKCSERCSFVACRKVLELSTQLLMQWKLIEKRFFGGEIRYLNGNFWHTYEEMFFDGVCDEGAIIYVALLGRENRQDLSFVLFLKNFNHFFILVLKKQIVNPNKNCLGRMVFGTGEECIVKSKNKIVLKLRN